MDGVRVMFEYLREIVSDHWWAEPVTWILPVAGAVSWAILKWFGAKVLHVRDFVASRQRALSAVARIKKPDGLQEGQGVWTLRPITQPDGYKSSVQSAHIVSIVNLKGGVGKTTIAANIGAYLANHPDWKRRVLLVDLDYQGSLSSMAFPDDTSWIPPAGTDSVATRAVSGELQSSIFLAACKEVRQEARLKVVTAYYDLAQADNRLMVEWLLNLRKPDRRHWRKWLSDVFIGKIYQANEMRYNLAQLLHSEAVRDNFDLVIIDCPPRLTSGTIQALCASSHVLIPTILDKPSAESVVSFCTQVETMKREGLCPYLRHLGIVATRFTPTLKHIDGLVQKITDELKNKNIKCGFLPTRTFIPQTVALVREADEGISYFNLRNDAQSQKAKNAIAELAHSVAHQAGVAPLLAYEVSGSEPVQLTLPVAAE